jgi:hypothetical protein
MKRWPILLSVLGCLMAPPALAASDEAAKPAPVDYSRKGIGFTAGATSGVGFAWRDVKSNGLGYSVGGGIWVDDFKNLSARWAAGVQGLKVLHQTDWWRLYALVGMQSYGYPTYLPVTTGPTAPVVGKTESPPELEVKEPVRVTESILNVGGGIGLELGGSPGVSITFELPVVLGYSFGPTPALKHLLPFPNLMVLYNF